MRMRKIVIAFGVVAAGLAARAQVRDLNPPRPAAPQTRDAQGRDTAPPQTGKSGISGVVVTDGQSPQPIKRAQVTVSNAEFTFTKTVVTNDAGKFSLANLPAGRYTLAASKPPFLRSAYGAKRYDRPGTPITLKDGEQMTDVALRMIRGGVLTGTILDENGNPAFGVSVRAMQLRIVNGERQFVGVASAGPGIETTDDRGTFRFFGLPPGEYAISATPRGITGEVQAMTESEIRAVLQALQQQTAAAQTPGSTNPNAPPALRPVDPNAVTVSYAPVYYPGATSVMSAQTVMVAPGEERRGVDFSLKLVRTARIEGTVVAPPGIAPQSVQLMLQPAATGPMSGAETITFNRAAPGADGKFAFTAVPPGDYQITARANPGAGGGRGAGPGAATFEFVRVAPPPGVVEAPMPMMAMPDGGMSGSAFWGQADVSVNGTALSGITIPMQPGMTVTGKVVFKGTRLVPDANLSRVRLTLTPAPVASGGARISMALTAAEIDASGNFKISGVTPGRYRLTGAAPVPQGSGPGMGWTMASAVVKGRDALDFPLDIAPNEEIRDVVVTFNDAAQEVSGTLQDATGRPAPDYTIVVFAEDRRYWTTPTRRTRTARPGTDGRFTIANLPPGEYRMAAVTDIGPTEQNDPAFLEQLVGASFKITLAEGEKKTQDLRISGGL